jgi:hypothetical protein
MSRRYQNKKTGHKQAKKNVAPMGNGYRVQRFGQVAPTQSLNSSFRGGFPDRARVRLVYPDNLRLTSTTTPATQVYRGNGPFDPDFTGTGSQPNNYDAWTLSYNQYRVWGATATITLSSPSATTFGRFVLAAKRVTTAPATSAALLGVASLQYTLSGLVGPNGIAGVDFNPARGLGTSVRLPISTVQFKGQTQQGFMGDENLASVFNTVPADQWFFVISVINLDGSSSTVYSGTALIEYDVEFFDRVEDGLDLQSRLERAIRIHDDSKRRSELRDENFVPVSPLPTLPAAEKKTRLPGR